jgi:hypothetical protein
MKNRDPKDFWYNPKLYRSKKSNNNNNTDDTPKYLIFIVGFCVGFYVCHSFF